MVVPSSEVLVPDGEPPGWREDAGEIRAMLKVYSPLTLLWAVPLRFLVGLLETIAAPFLGRWTLFGWAKAWAWNVVRLPSTVRARMAARGNRVVGDEELFRFQLRGSTDLRKLGTETSTALRDRLPGDDRLSLTELGRELRQPAFVVGALAVGFVAVATRTLWDGFPAVGYSLPLPASGIDLAGAYAGGWNPGGFGSTEPLEPFTALAGMVQTLAFGSAHLAAGVLVFGAFLAGIWGTTRLLRTWGVGAVPGTLAGLVLMAGPAGRAIAEGTGLGTLVALGILPWALRVPLARAPRSRAGWVGRIAATAWVTALVGLAAPALLPVPFIALTGLALITPREPGPWTAAGVSGLGALLALPILLPWVAFVDLTSYLSAGEAFWDPGWMLVVAGTAALACALVSAPSRLAQVAGWGGVMTAVGVLVARTGSYGPGRTVELAGTAVASLGLAVVCGVALEVITEMRLVTGWRRILAGVGVVAAMAFVVSTVLVFLPGRAGLPSDSLTGALRFTEVAEGNPSMSRGPAGRPSGHPSRCLPGHRGSRLSGHLGAGAGAVGGRHAAVGGSGRGAGRHPPRPHRRRLVPCRRRSRPVRHPLGDLHRRQPVPGGLRQPARPGAAAGAGSPHLCVRRRGCGAPRPGYRLGHGRDRVRRAGERLGSVVRRGHGQQPVGPRLAAGFVGERSVHRRRHHRVRPDRGAALDGAGGPRPLRHPARRVGVGEEGTMRRALLLALAVVTGLLALAVPRPAAPEEPTFTGPAIVEEEAVSASTVWYCPWLAADASRDGWLMLSTTTSTDVEITIPNEVPNVDPTVELLSYTGAKAEPIEVGALVRRGPAPTYVEFSAGPAAVSAIVTEDLADGSTLVTGDRCTSSVPKLWHLPGGTTREGRRSTLRLFNPFPDQAKVTVTGTSEFGEVGLVDLAAVDVPGRSWLTVDLNELVSLIETLSLTITADQGVVIPSMVVASDVDEASWPGTGLATTWEFPAARQTGLTPRVVVSNPGTAPVTVEVDVYSQDDWVESARVVEVPPATPVSIPVGDLIAGVFGLRVRASDPVSAVVDRRGHQHPRRRHRQLGGVRPGGGHGGRPHPQRRWLLPGPGSLPTAASAVWVLNSGSERVTVTLQPLGIDVMEPAEGGGARQPDRPHRAPSGKRRIRVRGVGAATDLGRVDRRVGERRRLRRRDRRRGVTPPGTGGGGHPARRGVG